MYIIWCGVPNTTNNGDFAEISQVRKALTNAWGPPAPGSGVTIDILYGDGMEAYGGLKLPPDWNAQPATRDSLTNVVNALMPLLNTNEQFFFYAGDHGSAVEVSSGEVPPYHPYYVPPAGSMTMPKSLDEQQVLQLLEQPGVQPYLNFDYVALDPGAVVLFNGAEVGELDPSQTNAVLAVPIQVLVQTNVIEVENLSGQTLELDAVDFYVGDVAVWSPPSASLVMSSISVLNSNAVSVAVQGEPGHAFEVQVSTDLVHWTTRTNGFLQNSTFQFEDGIRSQAFYRTVSSQILVISFAQDNGSVSPDYVSFVNPGASITFTATPNAGYAVSQWYVDGLPAQSGGATYHLNNVQSPHSVSVVFQ